MHWGPECSSDPKMGLEATVITNLQLQMHIKIPLHVHSVLSHKVRKTGKNILFLSTKIVT